MPSKRVSLKGKGADLFFGDYSPTTEESPLSTEDTDVPDNASSISLEALTSASQLESTTSATITSSANEPEVTIIEQKPRKATRIKQASTLASTTVSPLASVNEDSLAVAVETIRKTVKAPGKEVSFTRVTPEEKSQIADIIYTYKRQGQKTTENEINRIALNYLLNDYHEHGQASVLARVLAALIA